MKPSKEQFYNAINQDTAANDGFFKKVYGYSLYDGDYLAKVTQKLLSISRTDTIKAYSAWLAKYKEEQDRELRPASRWLSEQVNAEYEKMRKERRTNSVEGVIEWQQEAELLKMKRQLLLMKKSLLLTQN